jgi:hypothetical protein
VKYQQPSFSVNPSAAKAPAECKHGWVNQERGTCVLCGARVPLVAIGRGDRIVGYAHINIDGLAKR